MKQKTKVYIVSILIPIVIGFLGSLLGDSSSVYPSLNRPAFAPPGIVFPIVWSILYLLMGISIARIYLSNSSDDAKKEALIYYGIQLIFNSLWTLIFFRLKWFLVADIWILLILLFVIISTIKFFKIDKISAYLQIPYIIWLLFAYVLNFSIYILN